MQQQRTTGDGAPVIVRRSSRRRRTVAAFWEDGAAVVAIPAHFNSAQEREWVERMVAKLEARSRQGTGARRRPRSDAELMQRATELSAIYLNRRAVPATVRWVSNQNSRWGSATPADKSIRLSVKLKTMPPWVVDYVLLHELAHLLVSGHGAEFWELLAPYPQTERAKAFLEGVAFATSRGLHRGPTDADDGSTEEAAPGTGEVVARDDAPRRSDDATRRSEAGAPVGRP